MDNSHQNAHGEPVKAVTGGYSPIGTPMPSEANLIRLRVIISLFGLGLSDVAKAGQVSRPYVSRVLSGGLRPSPRFLRALESSLHRLVENRHGQVFAVEVTEPAEEEMRMVVGVTA